MMTTGSTGSGPEPEKVDICCRFSGAGPLSVVRGQSASAWFTQKHLTCTTSGLPLASGHDDDRLHRKWTRARKGGHLLSVLGRWSTFCGAGPKCLCVVHAKASDLHHIRAAAGERS